MKIELKDVQLFSFHGVHDEERRIGNDYLLNVSVEIKDEGTITSINDTVNYVTLYEIVQELMSQPTSLLETVATKIADTIHKRFPQVRHVHISLYKQNPLIAGFRGSVGVNYSKTY